MATDAAGRQLTSVAEEKRAALLVHSLAKEIMRLNEGTADTDKLIEARFDEYKDAKVLSSMRGICPLLGAEFLTSPGGDTSAFGVPDRSARFGGGDQLPVTRAGSAPTSADRSGAAEASNALSTPRYFSASAAATNHAATTTANASKEGVTANPCSLWRDEV